jgi:hypothetical protein
MQALQADKDDLDPQFLLIGGPLNSLRQDCLGLGSAGAEQTCRGLPLFGRHVIDIDSGTGGKAGQLTIAEVLQELAGVAVIVNVGIQILDPVLDRDIRLDEADRHGPFRQSPTRLLDHVVGRHQQIVLRFIMRLAHRSRISGMIALPLRSVLGT